MKAKGLLDKQPHRRNRKSGIQGIYKPDGEIVVRYTGKGQTKRRTAAQIASQQQFAEVVQSIKSVTAQEMQSAVELQRGTTLLWRDILMMAHLGTLWTIKTADGQIWMGARRLSQTIQNLLDSISDVPGTILGRTGSGWQALLPGTAGQVLTSTGPQSPPLWADAQGGTGGGGGRKLVQQIVAEAATDVQFTDIEPGYDYTLIGVNISNSTPSQPLVQFATGQPATWQSTETYNTGWAGGWEGGNTSAMTGNFKLISNTYRLSNDSLALEITGDVEAATWHGIAGRYSRDGVWFQGECLSKTPVTGFRIYMSAGTITGTFRLYKQQRI